MSSNRSRLTPARRRALDRLLVRYLELDEADRSAFVDSCRRRLPRLSGWLATLIEGSATVSVFDQSVHHLAREASEGSRAEPSPLRPGQRLGPWRIIEHVAFGGMGAVYRGERSDGTFEMEVAIKRIGSPRPGLAELLQRECRLLARLDHPAITRLMDAGLDEQAGPFLVMEWVEGQDLDAWLASDPDREHRLGVFHQLAGALSHAHRCLIVHGDIKPGNVRIQPDGGVKLLDFGIAQLVDSPAVGDRWTALTPAFAAPERMRGSENSTATDIWSLGALLGWLLTGKVPGKVEDGRICPKTGCRALDAIVDKACAVDPERRYVSAGELDADLARHRDGYPVQALPRSPGYVARCFVARNRLGVTLAGLIVASVLGGVGAVAWQAEQTQRAAERAIASGERAQAVKTFLADMISAADPSVRPGAPPTVKDVLDRSRERIGEGFADQPDIAADLLGVVGASYISLRQYPPAQETLTRAIGKIESHGGAGLEPERIAEIYYAAAHALRDPQRSPELATRGLESIRGVEGVGAQRARLMGILAYADLISGRTDEAIERGRESARLACQALPEDSATCVTRLSDLYYFLARAVRHDEALQTAQQGWTTAEAHLDPGSRPEYLNAGYAFAEALVHDHRPAEAIELLESLRAPIGRIYAEPDFPLASLSFRLARAERAAGNHHRAHPILVEALDTVAEHNPGSAAIPVQLNTLVDILLDLYKTDLAAAVGDRYADVLPEADRFPAHARIPERLNAVRLDALGSPDAVATQSELDSLIEQDGVDEHFTINALAFGVRQALETGNPKAARSWMNRLEALQSESGQVDPRIRLSRARLKLHDGDIDRALDEGRRALSVMQARGEHTGPRVATARALLAEGSCRQDRPKRGGELLAQSLDYWDRVAESRAGSRQMRRLAASCPH